MMGSDGVHRPRPQRGFLPSSISKSICTLAMKMVGDDTIRARVVDLIPEDFLMVEEVDSSSSSSASPPLGVGGRLAPMMAPTDRKGGSGGAFAFTNNSTPMDPDNLALLMPHPHELANSSSASAHHHTPNISPPFDDNDEDGDDSYSEWIAILTPSTADGGGLQFPASPTPTTVTTTGKPTAGNNNQCTTSHEEQQSLSLLSVSTEEGASQVPPQQSVAASPSPRRVHLRRNVSSLLELNFSLRASPLSTHYLHSQSGVGQDNCEGKSGGDGNRSEKAKNDQHHYGNDTSPHPQRVLSMAVAPPTRLGGGEAEAVTTRSQSPASDDDDVSSSSSSSCDPDLLTSRPHSPTTSSSSSSSSDDEHQNDDGDDTTPSRTPQSSNSASSPLIDGGSIRSDGFDPPPTSSVPGASSSQVGSWFESLFTVVLRSVSTSGTEETVEAPTMTSTPPKTRTSSGDNIDSQTAIPTAAASSPLPYVPPNTPTNLLERQFIIAAAYVLNAALIAGVKSADYILGQQQHHHQITHHHQVGELDSHQQIREDECNRGGGLSISAARLKANRIIQNFVEAAVDVIQHAWFTAHNY